MTKKTNKLKPSTDEIQKCIFELNLPVPQEMYQ